VLLVECEHYCASFFWCSFGAHSPAGGGRKRYEEAINGLIEKEGAGGREGGRESARVHARTARLREREQRGSGKVKDAFVEWGKDRRATGEKGGREPE